MGIPVVMAALVVIDSYFIYRFLTVGHARSKKPKKKSIVRLVIRYAFMAVAWLLVLLLVLVTFLLPHININDK